ncbi:MAG: thioesterase [Desulfosalsimonadaceae bacterium]
MKVSITRTLNYFDIGQDYRITLGALFRVLQEASSKHADDADNAMTAPARRWILSRIAADIGHYPRYGDTVTAVTWHRASKGYKSYREYELYAGDTRVASASTLWLYYDLEAHRLLKIPPDTGEKYGTVEQAATHFEIDAWKPDANFNPHHKTRITTRPTDYDPLHHVNNAVYFDYLLTLLCRSGFDPYRLKSIHLHYNKQIGSDVEILDAGSEINGNKGVFKIYDEDTIFASGQWETS